MAMLDTGQIEDILAEIEIEMGKTALRWHDIEKKGLIDVLGVVYLLKFDKLKRRKQQLKALLRERHSVDAVTQSEPDSLGPPPGTVTAGGIPRIVGPVSHDADGATWADAT